MVGGAGVDATIHSGYGMNYIANAGDFRNGGNARQNSMAWISMRTTGIFGVITKPARGVSLRAKASSRRQPVYYVWMPYTGGLATSRRQDQVQGYVGSSQGDPCLCR
jgi:hypothetical protein